MQLGERLSLAAPLTRLARVSKRWFAERSWREEREAHPLSAFDGDPDDGPENEGLMRYTR